MGYNCVSFYTDWALLEGEPGVYREDGIFALDKFMESAKEAGIYLIAVSEFFGLSNCKVTNYLFSVPGPTSMPKHQAAVSRGGSNV